MQHNECNIHIRVKGINRVLLARLIELTACSNDSNYCTWEKEKGPKWVD